MNSFAAGGDRIVEGAAACYVAGLGRRQADGFEFGGGGPADRLEELEVPEQVERADRGDAE